VTREEEGHLAEDRLELYALGRLPEDEVAELEEHLLICPACQDRLAETDAFIRAMRRAAQRFMMLPPSRWEVLWARLVEWAQKPAVAWVAAAACLAVVAVLAPRLLWGPARGPAPVSLLLEASRGRAGLAQAPAGKPLHLIWDTRGLPSDDCCRAVIVDSRGKPLASELVHGTNERAGLRTKPLSRGRYWVRLYALPPHQAMLREFGLEVQ